MSTAAYSLVWMRWYTSNVSNAILPHTLAVFAVGSTLIYCYDNVKNNTSWYSWLCCTYCCCITRTCTGMYNTQSNTPRKWHTFRAGIEIDFVVWVVEIDVISVWESRLTSFQCANKNWRGFVWGSKMTCFRVCIEIYLVFVSGGMQYWLVFTVGMEIDLISAFGSKLTWLRVGDISWLGFQVLWPCFVGGQNWSCVCTRTKNYLLLVWPWKLTCFCDGGRNWLDLSVGDRTWLNFSVGMKLIWLLCRW